MKLLIFGGTTEGRILAEWCAEHADTTVCVTTEYGASLITDKASILIGKKDKLQITELITDISPDIVIDATHPYAEEATVNIRSACDMTDTDYIRVIREPLPKAAGAVYFGSAKEAAAYLTDTQGRIFIATGTKEIPYFRQFADRCTVRILDSEENMKICRSYGFEDIITGLGPFSEEQNVHDFEGCSYVVTKESGKEGGFEEKIRACEKTGALPLIISRPAETGMTVNELLSYLDRRYDLKCL